MLRVLHDDPLDGPANMGRDEALLVLVGQGQSPPTLRTYRWSTPTVSLGYFQKHADFEQLDPPAGKLPVVRRLTGGGAILHDRELTYSITLPLEHPLLAEGPKALYAIVHDAVITGLRGCGIAAYRGGPSDGSGTRSGPFFCFARRHALDILIGDEKLAGSAQRRTRMAVLQHGSIVFERRYRQQPSAIIPASAGLNVERFRNHLADRLAERTGLVVEPGGWSRAELALGGELAVKYTGAAWARRF